MFYGRFSNPLLTLLDTNEYLAFKANKNPIRIYGLYIIFFSLTISKC